MPTHAERRSATRRNLLDASADVLVESGAQRWTTAAVTDRAGLSNGALFRHFPTRLELVAATVEHVLAELRVGYEATFADLDELTVETALDLLWTAMSDRRLAAILETYTEARTDDELLTAIRPIVSGHSGYVQELTARVAAAIAGHDEAYRVRLERIAAAAILSMQGAVVNQMAGGSDDVDRELRSLFRELASPDRTTVEVAL